MIADAQAEGREWSLILVYDVKRFGRVDNDEAGYYRHLLRTHGVEVRYVSEGFNGDATDDLLRPVKQWQAPSGVQGPRQGHHPRPALKDDNGRAARLLWGWMGGVPPLGYDLQYENERGEFLFVLRYMRDGSKQMLDQRLRLVRTLARGESVNITKRDRAPAGAGEASRIAIVRAIFHIVRDRKSRAQGHHRTRSTVAACRRRAARNGPIAGPAYGGLQRCGRSL
jgi:hypothetical protein